MGNNREVIPNSDNRKGLCITDIDCYRFDVPNRNQSMLGQTNHFKIEFKFIASGNRIIMTSMVTNYAARNGEVTDELICYHEERAKGGCAMNMLEATYVSPEGNSYFRGVGISDDFHVPGLKRLVDAVHARGGRIGVQLQHGGRTARSLSTGLPVLLVSAIPGRTPVEESREMVFFQ